MSELKLPNGTEITCPNCAKVMIKAKSDIYSGTIIGPHSFKQVEFTGDRGAHLECPFCKIQFGRSKEDGGHELHTKAGWL